MIYTIIGGMLALDVAWWSLSVRLTKRRPWWRWFASGFIAAQTIGFLVLILGRLGHWARLLPRPATVTIYLWHFLGLGIVLLVAAGAFPVLAYRQIRLLLAPAHCPDVPPQASEPGALSRREFLGIAAVATPPLFTLSLTGLGLAQLSHFRVRRYELPLAGLPRALDGMTIAHVSDIHVGKFTSGRILHQIAEATNALKADLVLLTGDLIDDALSDLAEGIALVHKLDARSGLCMIEGNHDLIENGAEFERRVRASGIPLLLNENSVVEVRGHPVQLLGVRWEHAWGELREAQITNSVRQVAGQREHEAFPILLAHHPHAFDAAAQLGLPLTLSGHTHGGQLMLSERLGCGPAMFRYWSGLYAKAGSKMVVSNGVGNWFPLRINAPAEIVHLTLRSQAT